MQITLWSGFLYFWGMVFFVTTTLVGVLKPEKADPDVDPEQSIVSTYKTLLNVIQLPAVLSYAFILLTAKVTLVPWQFPSALPLLRLQGVSGVTHSASACYALSTKFCAWTGDTGIEQFSEAGFHQWMPFVIFHAKSHKSSQLPLLGWFLSRRWFMLCLTM